MQSKRADVRIIESETLSDNWYILKNIPLICSDAMVNGSGKIAKFTTGETEPPSCFITGIKRR